MNATAHDLNKNRLLALIDCFQIPHSAVCKASGVSKTYVSLLLSGHLRGSDQFWRDLEANLTVLVQQRRTQFFEIQPASMEQVEGLLEIARR